MPSAARRAGASRLWRAWICLLYTSKDKNSPFAKIPAGLEGKKVVDISSTAKSVAAVTEDGEIFIWGNATKGEANVPELAAKPVHLYGGRYHYTALLENGDVVSWGGNKYGQSSVPESVAQGGDRCV